MKSELKLFGVFISLVSTIYFFRTANLSGTQILTTSWRSLQQKELLKACGSLNPVQTFTEDELDRADNVIDSLAAMRGGNPLYDIIDQGKTIPDEAANYLRGLIPVIAFVPAFFFITILIFISCICNWCCMYGCCKSCCEGCKCCKVPKYSKCRKTVYFIIAALLSTALVAASIAGAVVGQGIGDGVKRSTCSLVYIVDMVIQGNFDQKWAGVDGTLDAVKILRDNVIDIGTNLNTFSNSYTALDTDFNDLKTSINTLYNDNQVATLPRADPSEATTYSPDYIANLGPASSSGTYTYAITQEAQTKYDLVKLYADLLKSTVDTIKSTASSIQSALVDGYNTGQDIREMMVDAMRNLADIADMVNQLMGNVNKGIIGVFAVFLALGAIGGISMLITCLCGWGWTNKITHCSCCILFIFSILGFLCGTIVFPVSIVAVETCGVLDAILNQQGGGFMNKTLASLNAPTTVSDMIYTCSYGSKKIFEQFGIDGQITTFNDAFSSINTLAPYLSTSGVPDSYVIPIQQTLLDKYDTGKLPDSDYTTTDIQGLTTEASGTCSNDAWVLNSQTCDTAYPSYTVFDTNLADNQGFSQKKYICIGLVDEWGTTPSSSRYSGSSCTDTMTYLDSFIANRQALTTLISNLNTDLTDIETKNTAFMSSIHGIIDSPVNAVNSTLNAVYTSLADPNTGLLNNDNCGAVFDTLRNFRAALCVGAVTSLYETATVIVVCSFFTLFGAIFLFCFAKRGTVKEDESAKYQ